MPALRAIRLLQSVESTDTSGAELETFLGDAGRLGEFKFLLSLRGQTKRIANNQVTLDAILLSPLAVNAMFTTASADNDAAADAMTSSATAMSTLAVDSGALTAIFGNTTSRGLFTASASYSANVLPVTTLLAGLSTATYTTKDLLFAASSAMTAIFSDVPASQSVAVDQDMLTRTAAQNVAVDAIAGNATILAVFTPSTMAMTTFAADNSAMVEFITQSEAMTAFSQSSVAMPIIAANATAWATYKTAADFAANLKDIIANIIGVTPSAYANVDAIIADATAMALVAASTPACEALASSSAAITTLASSANLGIILGSATAMGVFGTEANIGTFLAAGAYAGVFGSAAANSVIVASNTLMDVVATTSAITDYLAGFAVTAIPSNLNSPAGSAHAFGGFPDKWIMLSIRANNIGAITMTHTIAATPLAGTTYSNVVSSSGVVTATVVFGVSNPATWTASGIGITSASSPETTYVDMTGAVG
jgi:hypothetical protein